MAFGKHKHTFVPVASPLHIEGKIYVVEWCKKCHVFQYQKVKSRQERATLEEINARK